MNLHEPATFMTDGLLGGLALYLAWRLRAPAPAARWWRHTFVLTAVSALVGGAYHGFAPNFPAQVGTAWWTLTLWSVGGVSAGLAMSLLHAVVPVTGQARWRVLVGTKLGLALAAAVIWPVFLVAIVDYGLALAAWLVAAMVTSRPWRGPMLAGIGLSVGAALVQQSGWSRLPNLNHNDLYHLGQGLALIAFFSAARRLGMSDKMGSP